MSTWTNYYVSERAGTVTVLVWHTCPYLWPVAGAGEGTVMDSFTGNTWKAGGIVPQGISCRECNMIPELKRTGKKLGWDDGDFGQRRNTL